MKKSILLFSACLVAGLANAQHAQHGIFDSRTANTMAPAPGSAMVALPAGSPASTAFTPVSTGNTTALLSGARTTSTSPRWYIFDEHILQPYQQALSHDVGFYGASMWNDTSAIFGYTPTSGAYYFHNSLLSVGLSFNPMWSPWNNGPSTSGGDANYPDFSGALAVTPAYSYTIDSVFIPGWYRHIYTTPAKTAVVDTLIVTFVEGNGGSSSDLPSMSQTAGASDYGTGILALNYLDLYRDITNNRAAHNGGGTVTGSAVYKFLLTAADSDASTYTAALTQYPRVGHTDGPLSFTVPAGHYMAMTVTFKSGDPSYPAFPAADTIRYTSGVGGTITGYKYSFWDPQIGFTTNDNPATSTSVASFGPYSPNSLTSGYFANEGRGWPYGYNKYYPNWDIVASLSPDVAAFAQYPNFGFHVVCPTCPTVGTTTPSLGVNVVTDLSKVTVLPNPANDQVAISFSQATGETATVSLTNTVGQEVAAQSVTNGKATFNTSALPAGVYIYSVKAAGQSATGRVVVAH